MSERESTDDWMFGAGYARENDKAASGDRIGVCVRIARSEAGLSWPKDRLQVAGRDQAAGLRQRQGRRGM